MSRSFIHCRACRVVLASRKHSGTIHVAPGIGTVFRWDGSLQLTCPCGVRRVLTMPEPKAA